MRWFEDFHVGDTHDLGSRVLTRDEIVDFARQWDPQPFHTDEEAAADGPFGGLVASGWQTACVAMRLYVDHLIAGTASMGSPGIEELRWLAPVRPGDELRVSVHVDDARPSATRADRGTVHLTWEVRNGDDVVVCRMRARGMFGRRPADAAQA